jgi:uncharacterized protein YrrD
MQLTIMLGSSVSCTDGKGGNVSHLVLNPNTNHLEYLVVHRGLLGGHDHCVPAGHIEQANADTIMLTLSTEELKEMPELEFTVPGQSFRQRSIPEACAALSKATPIKDIDGNLLGHFHGVVIGPEHQVERILLADKDDPGIPISQLADCSEAELTVRPMEQAIT